MTNHSAAPAAPHSADALKQTEELRADFEAWWRTEMNVQAMDLHRLNNGAYACDETARAWMAWQAAWNRRPTPASPDLVELRAKAEAAGSEAWNDEADADGYVFGSDGDSVCICHANMGHMPEPIYPEHRAAFIAAANPAAILALLDRLERAEADAKHYSMGADAEAKSADEWRERALRAEAAAGAVPEEPAEEMLIAYNTEAAKWCTGPLSLRAYRAMIAAAPKAAPIQPVAWSRARDIINGNGYPIGQDEPEMVWGKVPPDDSGWLPLFATPPAQDAGTGELTNAATATITAWDSSPVNRRDDLVTECIETLRAARDRAIANSGRTA